MIIEYKGPIDIEIRDLEDRQDILLKGEDNKLNELSRLFQSILIDSIRREIKYEKHQYISI